MTKNILFIVLPQTENKYSKVFPYGVLSISSYLRKNSDVNIKIVDCNLQIYEESIKIIKKELNEFYPDVVAISMNYDESYKYLEHISKISMDSGSIVVLGGSSASFSYKEILEEQKYIDGICYTEGEIPMTNLMNSDDMMKLMQADKSFITKYSLMNGKIPEKSLLTDLNDAIDIDYSLIDVDKYKMAQAFSPFNNERNVTQFYLITSRGCPYKCVFCATHSKLYDNKVRYASIENTINHIEYLIKNYNMNVLAIYDDQLLLNKDRAKELFRRLAKYNLRLECPNGLSVAFIDDEMARLMKEAGLNNVILAIEHGSEYVLRKVMHKPVSLKIVKSVVKSLRDNNIFVEASFVIGLPGEKEEHRVETINFIKDIGFDWCGFNLATPLRGSELYDICIENGYINKNLKIGEVENQMHKYIINTPDLIPDEISTKRYIMNLDVNFVNNYRMKIGDYEIAARCFQDVIRRVPDHAFAYYFLAEAQNHLKIQKCIIDENHNKFKEIVENDTMWKYYVTYFKLEDKK